MVKEQIITRIKEFATKFENPKIQRRFKGYNKTVQFVFPDIDTNVYMRIGDAELLEVAEGLVDDAELVVTMDSMVFLGILDKTQSPMAAYSSGQLKTKGEVPDLLKLQKLLL